MEHTIIAVPSADASRAVAAITSGFIADPVIRWMFPEAHDYLESFPKMLYLLAAPAFEDGTVYADENFGAAAIWLAPGKTPDEEALQKLIGETIRPEILEDLLSMLEQMDSYHPHDDPCWYLPNIGADASQQGRGLGSALMKHALKRCDEEGIQASLESSNPANMTLYERHGFQVMGRIDAGSAPPIHPMIRPAG